MANDYNILADYIVSRYIERIAGDDIEETFVDESPADRVMVGMLAENRMEEKFDGGSRSSCTACGVCMVGISRIIVPALKVYRP